MNLAWRDIRHHLGRFLLTCVGLGLLLGVVLSMIGIYRGLVDDALTLVRAPAADLWVVEAGRRGPFAEASRIPGDTRETVARLHGVAAAGSLTIQTIEVVHRGQPLRLSLIGIEPGRPGEPERLAEGRAISRGHYELIADRRTGLVLGDRVRLGRNDFTVVGLTAGVIDSGGNAVAFVTLRDAQKIQFDLEGAAARNQAQRGQPSPSDTLNAVVARLRPGVSATTVATGIERWKHLTALSQEQEESLLLTSVVDKARRQIGLFTVTLLTVSAVVIALIIHTMTMDKMREIATLKLIGAPDRTIIGLIIQQALAMGVIGFALGATLLILVADKFPRRVLLLPEDALGLCLVVIGVCALASLLGVRLALRIDPAQALGG
ncbi:putative ABC transport system permease protein [uncultured Gammaproteobacteria bacterium]